MIEKLKRWAANKKDLVRPLVALAIVAGLILLVLHINGPTVKEVTFDIACEGFVTPLALDLNLDGAVQMRSANLHGFGGEVTDAEFVTTRTGRRTRTLRLHNFKLEIDADQASPSLIVKPLAPEGIMTASVSEGAALSSTFADPPRLKVESKTTGDVKVKLQSRGFQLDENLYRIPELLQSNATEDEAQLDIAGGETGTTLTAGSGPASGNPVEAEITFAGGDGKSTAINTSEIKMRAGVSVVFSGVLKPAIEIEKKKPTDIITDQRTRIEIVPENGVISGVGIVLKGKTGEPGLDVMGSAKAKSVTQDGRELLPTLVQQILDQPYDERTFSLVLMGLAAFAMFKVVDRAFEILLKRLLPGE